MASVKEVKDIRNYCDLMFGELKDMKARLLGLVQAIENMQGYQKQTLTAGDHGPHDHISHLRDIANTIDWKLEILTKVCPADWMKYAEGSQQVSVKVPGKDEFNKGFAAPGDFGG